MRALTDLPHVDEHETVIAAGIDDVWSSLLATLDHSSSRPGVVSYARAVGCADPRAAGPRPLTEGSAIPGFRVVAAVPPTELVLQGSHRFSSYALTFRLEPDGPVRTRVRAETRAAFPGVAGRAYRLLVIGTGAHVLGVRRLLAGLRRQAEQPARGPA